MCISINNSNQDCSPANDYFNNLVDLGVGAAFTMFMPTMWYCSTIGRIWPLQLLGLELAVGTIIGGLLYWLRSSDSVTVIDLKPPRVTPIETYRRRRTLVLPK